MDDRKRADPDIDTFLEYMFSVDYKERPVGVVDFIRDSRFLGKATSRGRAVYPVWIDALDKLFSEDSRFLVVFTGAIGTGKTYADMMGIAYVLYRILCLRDPWGYFGLSRGSRMAVAFFNLTRALSMSKGFSLLQSFLLDSPWFLEKGQVRGKKDRYLDIPLFRYVLASPYSAGFGTVGEDVICASMDEVDAPEVSVKQKEKVLKAYDSTVRRFESRFVSKDGSLGRFFLVASKQDEMSFLNVFIEEMKGTGKIFMVDIPLWEAKPAANYSGERFMVSIGDVYTSPRIIEGEEEKQKALVEGYDIVEVPVEYRNDFERDIVGALRDIAGRSVHGFRKSKLFPAEKFLFDCYDQDKPDPVARMTIDIGLEDDVDLIDFINLEAISLSKNVPRHIHVDIAYSGEGDALGLAMSGICGWTEKSEEDADGFFTVEKVPVIETDFCMRVKARPGDQVPIYAVRKLVMDLKRVGFNIKNFTSDLRLASTDMVQVLKKRGIDAGHLSMDKDVQAYLDFRSLVFEGRWVCHKSEYLHFELKNLILDRDRQKVDHPDKVMDVVWLKDGSTKEVVLVGSKDVADAVAGSVVGVLRASEEPPDAAQMRKLAKKVVKAVVEDKRKQYWWTDIEKAGKEKVVAEADNPDEGGMKAYVALLKKVR